MPSETVFLVNPAAEGGSVGRSWPELAHRAAALGLSGDALLSERPGQLGELAGQGLGVLLASSELPELVGVCDRVVVLRDGRDVASFSTAESSEGDLLAAAMGEGSMFENAGGTQ